jgi:hypothetical protein
MKKILKTLKKMTNITLFYPNKSTPNQNSHLITIHYMKLTQNWLKEAWYLSDKLIYIDKNGSHPYK